jgi:hypothetical protein
LRGAIGTIQTTVNLEKRLRLYVVASELISAFSLVTHDGYNADSSNVFHRGKIAGMSIEDIATGTSGKVVSVGIVVNPLWSLSVGNILYLNGTSISIVPPSTGFRIQVGEVLSSTSVYMRISEPILL